MQKTNLFSMLSVFFLKILSIISNLLISFLFVKIYSINDFGEFTFNYLSCVILGQVFCLGLPQIIVKQISNYQILDEVFIYAITQVLILGLILNSVVFLLIIFFLNLSSAVIALTGMVIALNTLLSAYLRVKGFLTISQVSENVLRHIIVLISLVCVSYNFLSLKSENYLLLILVGVCLGASFQSAIILKYHARELLNAFAKVRFSKFLAFLEKYLHSSIRIFCANFLNQLNTNIAILLSGYLVSYHFLGELRIAWQIASLMFLMLQVSNIVFGPEIASMADTQGSKYLLFRIQKLLIGINFILAVAIYFLLEYALVLLFDIKLTHSGMTYIWVLLTLASLEVSLGPVGQFLVLQGNEQYYLWASVAVFLPAFVIIALLFYFDLLIVSVVCIGLSRLILKVACYQRVLVKRT